MPKKTPLPSGSGVLGMVLEVGDLRNGEFDGAAAGEVALGAMALRQVEAAAGDGLQHTRHFHLGAEKARKGIAIGEATLIDSSDKGTPFIAEAQAPIRLKLGASWNPKR